MLSEKITSLADVSFHIVAYMYARFRYSGKNPMRFAVFWRISVRFGGFPTPLTPPPPLIYWLLLDLKISLTHTKSKICSLKIYNTAHTLFHLSISKPVNTSYTGMFQ